MTLTRVIEELNELPDDATLFVQEPWSAWSACVVHAEVIEGPYASFEERYGMSYFLEVDIIKDQIEQLMDRTKAIGHEELVNRLIQYARNDA